MDEFLRNLERSAMVNMSPSIINFHISRTWTEDVSIPDLDGEKTGLYYNQSKAVCQQLMVLWSDGRLMTRTLVKIRDKYRWLDESEIKDGTGWELVANLVESGK